jgi:hypothetical protein
MNERTAMQMKELRGLHERLEREIFPMVRDSLRPAEDTGEPNSNMMAFAFGATSGFLHGMAEVLERMFGKVPPKEAP